MPHEEGRLETGDGLQLQVHGWLPEGQPRAVVVLVHGVAEHSGRYAELAARLNRPGHAVYAMDLRGHGNSAGRRIFVRRFDQYLDDLDRLVEHVRREQPGKPLFLFGHSMGGAIVARSAISRRPDVDGLVLSAAALEIGPRLFPFLRRLASIVAALVPTLPVVKISPQKLSRDPATIAQFENDPLVFHGYLPVRTGAEILRAIRHVHDRMEAIEFPLLLLHGTGDVITDPEGSRQLHARARSTDKTLKLYDGLYHDLFHEPEKDQVIADLIEWLEERVSEERRTPAINHTNETPSPAERGPEVY